MPLDEDDVREILRLIDESDGEELRVETEAFSADGGPRGRARAACDRRTDGLTIVAPILGTFYRAPAPGAAPFVDVGSRVEADTSSA